VPFTNIDDSIADFLGGNKESPRPKRPQVMGRVFRVSYSVLYYIIARSDIATRDKPGIELVAESDSRRESGVILV